MTEAATGNASDPKQVKAAAKTERRTRLHDLNDLRTMLGTRSARRWYWKMLSSCGVFELSYSRGGDTHDTAFHEGERNVGLRILKDLMDADSKLYGLMADENKEEVEDAGTDNGDNGPESDEGAGTS